MITKKNKAYQAIRCLNLIESMDYLRSEYWKLQKQLDALERNFEAKSKVYSEHSETKKLQRDKKNFQLKREIILAEMSSINENIKKIETQEKMERDVAHKHEWKNIESELLGYTQKDFRSFFKQFGEACLRLKKPMMTIDEIYQEIDLDDETLGKIINHIKKNFHGVCGISKSFDYGLSTRFARELAKI